MGDRPYLELAVRLLDEDRFGTWIHAPTGTSLKRRSGECVPLRCGFVGIVPDDEWWVAEFYGDHPEMVVCINIGTPPGTVRG